MRKVWKQWLGIILIGSGISNTFKHSNYWMLLFCLAGVLLCYWGKDDVQGDEKSRLILGVTAIVITFITLNEFFNFY